MRRDYFTLEARNLEWVEEDAPPERPTAHIDFRGPETDLRAGFMGGDGMILEASETDISFRLQGDPDEDETRGVVAVTNRITGDFIFEINVATSDVFRFIEAAKRFAKETDDESAYRVELSLDGEEFVTYEKDTFLVYTEEGALMRSRSLIPSGVEL